MVVIPMPDFTEILIPEERALYDALGGQVETLRARVDTERVTVIRLDSEMDQLKQYIVNDLPEVIVEWFSRYFDPSITEESTKEMRDSLRELLSSGFPS